MTKKYTLTTSEETVTENPEDIIRLMKLAGLENAQPVSEETEEWANTPDGSSAKNDDLDLDDYSKKSPESISKQKKSIQPTLGDNPLEYSLDENEIYDAMMKEFPEDKVEETTEEITEKQSPAQKAAFEKMLAAKNGGKDEAVEEKEEETTVEENLEKAQEQINELKEGCSCGCGSDCNCGPECGCGCNAVNEDQDRMAKLAGLNERGATRPMNFAGTKDHRIKGDTSKSGPEVDTLKHVDKIQKLAWNKAKAKPSHHDSSSKQAKIDIIMPKKRDTVAIKGDSTKASPHTKASKIDIKGDSSKANPNAKEPKIGIKGDSSKSKLRGEDLDRLRKLSGIQEKGSAKNPSTDPALDDLSQSFDWPEDGPKIDIDNMGKMLKVTVKEPKGTKGSTLNYDDRIQRLARKKDTGKMTPPKGDLPLSLKARVGF